MRCLFVGWQKSDFYEHCRTSGRTSFRVEGAVIYLFYSVLHKFLNEGAFSLSQRTCACKHGQTNEQRISRRSANKGWCSFYVMICLHIIRCFSLLQQLFLSVTIRSGLLLLSHIQNDTSETGGLMCVDFMNGMLNDNNASHSYTLRERADVTPAAIRIYF